MLKIKEHIATEELLKMYFFKLYARKNDFFSLYFHEDILNAIINSKALSEMNSNELFACIKIERRGFGFDTDYEDYEDFDAFIPSKFYFIEDSENSNKTIFEHSFLYTNFKLIDELNLFEAEIGLNGFGCDLINGDGDILKTVVTNLYDYGYYKIKVSSKNPSIFLLIEYDENNGYWLTFFSFIKNNLIKVDELGDKFLILEFLEFGYYEILDLASEDIKDDSEILLAAVNVDTNSLNFASDRLRDNKSFFLKAVTQDGYSLKYASEDLRNDREVVFAAVSNRGCSLMYASDSLRNDKDIVLKAVSETGYSLRYASEELRNDREAVFAAVSNPTAYVDNDDSLNYASDRLRDDKDIVLKAVSKNGYSLKYASEDLRNDREVVFTAVSNRGDSLMYASDSIRNDKDIVLKAVSQNGASLQYASENLRNNKEVAFAAVSDYIFAIKYVGEKLKNDVEILGISKIIHLDDLPF